MVPAQPYVSSSACGVTTSSRCFARNSSGNISTLRSARPHDGPSRPPGRNDISAGETVLDDATDDVIEPESWTEPDEILGARDVRDPAHGVLEAVAVREVVGD